MMSEESMLQGGGLAWRHLSGEPDAGRDSVRDRPVAAQQLAA